MEISVPTVFKVEFKDKIRDKRGGPADGEIEL